MGYRGKVAAQERARELRAEAWTLDEIATELGVSKSSVSLWVRDVAFVARPRSTARRRGPNALQRAKAEEIERLLAEGRERVGELSDRDLLIAGIALYAGEGSKTPGEIRFANSDPRMICLFLTWLRRFFDVDESRLRLKLYLHIGLDLDAANAHWSALTGIPLSQFRKPYRAKPDPSIRTTKHEFGCPSVCYGGVHEHRQVMGLVGALLPSEALSGVAQSAAQGTVNAKVLGSSPSPGASTTS
jgi:transcriptional regulator with XRE-family HTH domain